ncbi:hypothetical protein HDU98_004985 [Podochytrium sp. JEL0797]|nr:hypothetical protein HDU98_004985 [Podochytrium sp. JEL0797]
MLGHPELGPVTKAKQDIFGRTENISQRMQHTSFAQWDTALPAPPAPLLFPPDQRDIARGTAEMLHELIETHNHNRSQAIPLPTTPVTQYPFSTTPDHLSLAPSGTTSPLLQHPFGSPLVPCDSLMDPMADFLDGYMRSLGQCRKSKQGPLHLEPSVLLEHKIRQLETLLADHLGSELYDFLRFEIPENLPLWPLYVIRGNMSLAEPNPLASKAQSNITLALIDWYCLIPGIQYSDGAWLSGYATAFNATNVSFNDKSGFVYTQDLAVAAAVSVINSKSDILPYTTVNIKRFSDCGPYWAEALTQFHGQTTGFAMSKVAIPIGETHTDVVAVVGGEYSSTAK